jgi:hypothetical protein
MCRTQHGRRRGNPVPRLGRRLLDRSLCTPLHSRAAPRYEAQYGAMKRLLGCLLVLGLGACPSMYRVNVRATDGVGGAAIEDAVVGAICDTSASGAGATDAGGLARIEVSAAKSVEACEVIVAKEGFATQELRVRCADRLCEAAVRLEAIP